MRRRSILALSAGVFAAAAWAGVAHLVARDADRAPEAVAMVNGEVITAGEFSRYQDVFRGPDGSVMHTDDDILLSLINIELALQEAQALGIEVTDAQLDVALERFRETDPALFDLVLRTDGIDRYRESLRQYELYNGVRREVTKPSQSEIETYFDAHTSEFNGKTLAEARHEIELAIQADNGSQRWKDWLSSRQRCSAIKVLMSPAPSLPPRDPTCAARSDSHRF